MRVRMVAAAVAAIATLAATSSAGAETASYSAANQAYLTGDWQSAARQYQALVDAGLEHPDLFYNLGNAQFRLGQLGPAIYNYERALRLDPGMDDARHNLVLARETVQTRWGDKVAGAGGKPFWKRAATWLSTGQLSLLFVLINGLFFGSLIALRLVSRGGLRVAFGTSAVLGGLATAGLALLLTMHIWYLEKTPVGIVLDDEVRLLEGRDDRSRERWVIHAGLEVTIVDREPGWLKVELANQTQGWVRESAIGEL